jgi:hypothetical protein
MTSGISARCGILRTICKVVSVSLAESCDRPLARPTAKPMLPPIRKPMLARQELTQTLRTSSPDHSSFHPASATSLGAGNPRADTNPVMQASCQIRMMESGTNHGIKPSILGNFGAPTRGRLSMRLMIATPVSVAGIHCRWFLRTVRC